MKRNEPAIVISKIIQKIQLIIGVLFAVTFGYGTIYAIIVREPEQLQSLPLLIIMDIITVLLIVFGRKRKKLVFELNKYMGIISHCQSVSITYIAEELGEAPEAVKKNLETLIKKNYLTNAYINYETNFVKSIDAPNPARNNETSEYTQPQEDIQEQEYEQEPEHTHGRRATPEIEYIHITCRHCGGVTKIQKGTAGKCDYCGSPLE